jgi:anaphase-promoting complex subunit 6
MGACRGESWIAAGHSFASEGDHDAAMTAYRAAARVVSGSHLPSLYTGVQYVHYFIYESAQLSFEASRLLCFRCYRFEHS